MSKATKTRGNTANDASGAGGLDQRLVKAMAHPLRHRLLVLLNERVASPNELAQQVEQPLGRVSYHVRTLAQLGAIELVRTEPRRGAVEHFYRAMMRPWFSEQDWAELPTSTRRGVFGQNLARIWNDATAAAAGTGFDHAQAHVSLTPLELDEDGMRELSALLSETVDRALQIHAEAAGRRDGSDDPPETHSMELAVMHFERAPAGAADAKPRAARRRGRK